MASEIPKNEEGLPWLSWAMTGILSMAVVVMAGVVISARNPRLQAQSPAAVAAKLPVGPKDSAALRQTSPAPPAAGSSLPAVAEPARSKETKSRVAATAAPTTAEIKARPDVSSPASKTPPHPAGSSTTAPNSARPTVAAEPPAVVVKPNVPAAVETVPTLAAVDPAKHAAFVRAVAEVRSSMAHRDLATAKQKLQTASANAQDAVEQAELDRLEILQDHLEQFWDGISKAVAAKQPVDEIVLTESNRVAVIEASRTELAVQWEGRQQRFRITALPRELLWAITQTSFKPTPGSKLIVGAFLAMDAAGDRDLAGKLWQEASRSGESEGKTLLSELDVHRKP